MSRFYSFTQDSTSFIKLGLQIGFHQLEPSLVSHSIAIFKLKKGKNDTKDYFLGILSIGGTITCRQINFPRLE